MIATSLPTLAATSRISVARSMWSCAVPCEKLRRITSTPARIIRSRTSALLDAGPRVATILVARGTDESLMVLHRARYRLALMRYLSRARRSRISSAGSVLPSSTSRKAPPPVEM